MCSDMTTSRWLNTLQMWVLDFYNNLIYQKIIILNNFILLEVAYLRPI